MAFAMEEETTMMIPPQGMDEDMTEGIASLPEQGNSGIADLPQAAQQLAQLGRAQDTFLGHLAQDEVVIPRELLQASPKLEEVIRDAFEAEGMDYTQYVVGSEENSINPETGLPEFFIKKALKKLERAVRKPIKKVAKKVEKATRKKFKKVARELKKAAPVVLPIALNFMFPGAGLVKSMLLSAGGSGIGTLIAGGSTKDALRAAAIAAAVTGAVKGAANYKQTGSIMGGDTALTDTTIKKTTEETIKDVAEESVKATTESATQEVASQEASKGVFGADLIDTPLPKISTQPPSPINVAPPPSAQPTGILDVAKQKTIDAYNATKDAVSKVGDYMTRGGQSKDAVLKSQQLAGEQQLAELAGSPLSQAQKDALVKKAMDQAAPGALAKFGPTAALLYGASKFGGGGEEGDDSAMEEFNRKQAEKEAIAAQIPNLPVGSIDYITAQQTLAGAPDYQYLNPIYRGGYFLDNPMMNNPMMNNPTLTTGVAMARRGGEMAMTNLDTSKFPRRTGQISGPGTETSDSIPAMLSDGEFVMNARAVRGAGNGSREAGVRKMYDMMRNFESKVA